MVCGGLVLHLQQPLTVSSSPSRPACHMCRSHRRRISAVEVDIQVEQIMYLPMVSLPHCILISIPALTCSCREFREDQFIDLVGPCFQLLANFLQEAEDFDSQLQVLLVLGVPLQLACLHWWTLLLLCLPCCSWQRLQKRVTTLLQMLRPRCFRISTAHCTADLLFTTEHIAVV